MARNEIGLDQINARLGDMRQSRSYSDVDSAAQSGQTHNIGFLVSVSAIFLAVSSVTFMFAGGYNPLSSVSVKTSWGDGGASYFSPVDLICGKAWVKGGRNEAALLCYLNTKMERLCDVREKNHLARLIKQFRTDAQAFEAAAAASTLAGAATASVAVDEMLEGGAGVAPAASEHSEAAVVAAIRKVGAMGYMKKADYGWIVDSLVTDAYKGQLQPPSACKTQ